MTFRRNQQTQTGYTLLEMSIALGIGMIIIAGVISLSMFSARSFEALTNYTDMDQQSRFAMDTVTKDIRRATRVDLATSNQLVMEVDGVTMTNNWDPATGLLTRQFLGGQHTLLTHCDYLSFQMFTRNPGNNFTFLATTDPTLAKLVGITWRCSRYIYGNTVNTENFQSTMVVIRN